MSELFLKIINMSISASWLVLAVLILRLVLRSAPRWSHVLLWGVVAARLLCPVSIESAWSLIPSAETIPLDIGMDTTPAINSGITAVNSVVNPIISQSNIPAVGASVNPLQITIAVYETIWVLGVTVLLVYTAVSYFRLSRRIGTAVRLRDNIYQSECVTSPFVLGIISPKIYLPFRMEERDLEHVIAHEQAHIRRKDHWWKPLGFLLLAVHWFNPLMWLAYVLLCRDIELACDEKVIRELRNEQRADYSQALLSCSVDRRMISACPLAFGEVGVKERVRSVLHYKKPAFWVVVTAVIVCAVVAVCFLTNPKDAIEGYYWIEGYGFTGDSEYFIVVNDGVELKCTEEQYEKVTDFMKCVRTGEREDTPIHVTYKQFLISYKQGTVIELEIPKESTLEFRPTLSLNDVIILSQKGYDLTWSDFDSYKYIETGFGLYIRSYEINALFRLSIGGAGPNSEPMYIYLTANDGTDARIDIRDGGVTEFISQHSGDLVRIYRFDEVAFIEGASWSSISLYENGEFSFSFSPISSYWGYGTYEIKDDRLTLRTDDGKYVYVFDMKDDAIVFDAEASSKQTWFSELYDGAVLHGGYVVPSTAPVIEALFDAMEAAPVSAGDPAAFMPEVYQELIGHGDETLGYIYREFLAGGQTGWRGQLMQAVLGDMIGGEGIQYAAKNGQDYFDQWLNSAKYAAYQNGEVYVKERMPKTWLLLETAGYFDDPQIVTGTGLAIMHLTGEEIDRVNEAFAPFLYDAQGNPSEVNPLSCFFTSYYHDVTQMDFIEFMRYFPGAGEVSQAEFDALRRVTTFPYPEVLSAEEMPVPIHKYSGAEIEQFLNVYAGISVRELELLDYQIPTSELIYLSEYDAYYNFTSDAGAGTFYCTRGEREGNIVRLYEDSAHGTDLLTLRRHDDGYHIVSHQHLAD